jgi:hypothetical protein
MLRLTLTSCCRAFILGVLTVFVLAPLVSMRNMSRLAPVNIIGVCAVFAFAAVSAGLAGVAVASGQAYEVKWQPDPTFLHGGMLAVIAQVAGAPPSLSPCWFEQKLVSSVSKGTLSQLCTGRKF